jgi:short subunit dehydrogenase-like uncharacterized protein
MIESSTTEQLRKMSNPFALAPRDKATNEPIAPSDASVVSLASDSYSPTYDSILGKWMMPWVMQAVNTRIVNRSNAVSGWSYGRNLIYREFSTAPGLISAVLVSALYPVIGTLMYFPFTRNILRKFLPKPGQGPSIEQLEGGFFEIKLWGRGRNPTTGNEEIVKGGINAYKGDGGYK